MNPLTLLGGPWSSMLGAVLLGIAVGGTAAWKVHTWRHDAQKAEELADMRRMGAKRESVTAEVTAKHAASAERIRTVTVTQIKEVPTYVSANDCPLSPGFRVLHDAAAAGELPDPSGIADAAAVPAPAVANAVVQNYGTCTETAQRLTDLQDWVRSQRGVN